MKDKNKKIYEPLYLDDDTFEEEIKDSPITFVMAMRQQDERFSAAALPKFRAAGEYFKDKIKFVALVDERSPKTKAKWNIFAFPSFFVFRYGVKTYEYPYSRETLSIVSYLQRILSPPVQILESARDVHDFLQANILSVILAGEDLPSDLVNVFNQTAQNLTDSCVFAIANTNDAIQQLGVEDTPSIQLHRNEDRVILDFSLAFDATFDQLKSWIQSNIIPKYRMNDEIIYRDLMFDPRYTLLTFVDTTRKKSLDRMHNILTACTEEFRENFTYVYSDIYDGGNIVLHLGFSGAIEPCFAIVKLSNGTIVEKYLFPERREATPLSVIKFINDFIKKAQSTSRSQRKLGPFGKSLFKGAVFQLEEKDLQDLNDIVNDPVNDVALLILSGNQTKRENSKKVFVNTAKEFHKQKVDSFKFYIFDADQFDIEQLKLPEFDDSAFILYPTNEKNAMFLPGDLTIADFMSALLTHSKSNPTFEIPSKYTDELSFKSDL